MAAMTTLKLITIWLTIPLRNLSCAQVWPAAGYNTPTNAHHEWTVMFSAKQTRDTPIEMLTTICTGHFSESEINVARSSSLIMLPLRDILSPGLVMAKESMDVKDIIKVMLESDFSRCIRFCVKITGDLKSISFEIFLLKNNLETMALLIKPCKSSEPIIHNMGVSPQLSNLSTRKCVLDALYRANCWTIQIDSESHSKPRTFWNLANESTLIRKSVSLYW